MKKLLDRMVDRAIRWLEHNYPKAWKEIKKRVIQDYLEHDIQEDWIAQGTTGDWFDQFDLREN